MPVAFQPEECDYNKFNHNVKELQRLIRTKNTELSEMRLLPSESGCTIVSRGQEEETLLVGRKSCERPMELCSIQDNEARERQFWWPRDSQKWTRAQNDFPCDTPYSNRRYPTALVYDYQEETFYPCRVNRLYEQQGIISRLPSRWGSAIHVYVEVGAQTPNRRVKVTNKRSTPIGMTHFFSIHARKLPVAIRLRVLLGEIRWFFIK
ncbi:hypothetical protein F5Y10DRAFT_269062 [Nemania abortiva]|nr:hypothetical protein F5Y10DRAFT_269062 [Nemania abortiva]